MSNKTLVAQSKLRVNTSLIALEEVLQWFEQLASPLLPSDSFYKCQIALTEGFTNVVRHAHEGLPETTPIDLEVKVFSNVIEMRIWDWGQPFDLQKKLESALKRQLDPLLDPLDMDEGGRGLIFMSKLTDELSYIRQENGQNCLVLKKNIP